MTLHEQATASARQVEYFRQYLALLEAVSERARDLSVSGAHGEEGTFECASEDAQDLHHALQQLDRFVEQQGGR